MRRSHVAVLAALLAGCSTAPTLTEPRDGPPSGSVSIPDLPGSPEPRPEPRSRYGNPAEYEVLGQRYRVMESSYGYRERGVASWYGKKFHGRLTSSRETYNMYAMSAAHKSLPLPTYVRVRNLDNNKSVVVRVNDRGPFAHNRIIDLSYAAAMRLDMIDSGTANVEVTAISFDRPTGDQPTRTQSAPASSDFLAPDNDKPVYLQVGAFGERANAEQLRSRLAAMNISGATIHRDDINRRALFRVRIGPITSVAQFEDLGRVLDSAGIDGSYLVSD
ncbi:MAG: septal ring lytic transglycosylase RlpA family protein [Pseudomonadota bacterium]